MRAIIDTGPWVALLDKSESKHDICIRWFKTYSGTLYSTEAVLTEVLHLLNFSITAQDAALEFVTESMIELVPANIESTKKVKALMKKYSDLPMDYADATIVCLAMEAGIQNIVTFDKRDFNIYRTTNNQNFIITP
jgi:predicted nucleic acid-binding protein